jgi:hypothetical protein
MKCEITLVRDVEDAFGTVCARNANEQCSDCGTHVCDLHAESCDLCGKSFCSSCLYFHMNEPHAEQVVPVFKESAKRSA